MPFTVRDPDTGNERTVDSRSEAEAVKADMAELGIDAEIIEPTATDGGAAEVVESDATDLPERSLSEDPIDWMPSHFVDDIQGVPVLNRKAYCVIAERYGVSVVAEPITLPAETDYEGAVFRAIATTEDGREYSGIGSAHVDRDDDAHLLAELAETRAMKRSMAWASGVGVTAISEMQGTLEET